MVRAHPRDILVANAPFKSSYLALPPSPFSPKFPITPPVTPPKSARHFHPATAYVDPPNNVDAFPPPPPTPMHWLWQCHKCHRVYGLGVTRRCLDDGHFFCAGTTTVKRSRTSNGKKVVRHQACASEFDYQGWKSWGRWRRELEEQHETAEELSSGLHGIQRLVNNRGSQTEGLWLAGAWSMKKPKAPSLAAHGKDCWRTCDYPSECRWGKQYGVHTPVSATSVVPSSPVTTEVDDDGDAAMTDFESILIGLADAVEADTASGNADFGATLSKTEIAKSIKGRGRRSSSTREGKPSRNKLLASIVDDEESGLEVSPGAGTPGAPATKSSASQYLSRALSDWRAT